MEPDGRTTPIGENPVASQPNIAKQAVAVLPVGFLHPLLAAPRSCPSATFRRRLRMYLWRQRQNGPKRFKELRRRGVPKFLAAVAAGSPTGFWRMSGHSAVQMALRNHVFDALGLPRLYIAR